MYAYWITILYHNENTKGGFRLNLFTNTDVKQDENITTFIEALLVLFSHRCTSPRNYQPINSIPRPICAAKQGGLTKRQQQAIGEVGDI